MRIVKEASDILKVEPTLLEIKPSDLGSCTVSVVGDTHGQYHDVLRLFETVGYPSEDHVFIFNGDFVDRGAWGVETLALLLAWKVAMPRRVYLLRGNHESTYCTKYYGFQGELTAKYGPLTQQQQQQEEEQKQQQQQHEEANGDKAAALVEQQDESREGDGHRNGQHNQQHHCKQQHRGKHSGALNHEHQNGTGAAGSASIQHGQHQNGEQHADHHQQQEGQRHEHTSKAAADAIVGAPAPQPHQRPQRAASSKATAAAAALAAADASGASNHAHGRGAAAAAARGAQHHVDPAAQARKDVQDLTKACRRLFALLPLGALVGGRTLVLHGGLFRAPPSAALKGKKRRSAKSGPLQLGTLADLRAASKGGQDPNGVGASLVACDVLWSDPVMEEGLRENEARGGVGCVFGPDATEAFLSSQGLRLIIRSHEGPDARLLRDDMGPMDEGYTVDHKGESGQLVTVFSAPDYPQFQAVAREEERTRNKAAVVRLSAPSWDEPRFEQFDAALPRPRADPYYDFEAPTELGSSSEEEDGEEGTSAVVAAAAGRTAQAGDKPSSGYGTRSCSPPHKPAHQQEQQHETGAAPAAAGAGDGDGDGPPAKRLRRSYTDSAAAAVAVADGPVSPKSPRAPKSPSSPKSPRAARASSSSGHDSKHAAAAAVAAAAGAGAGATAGAGMDVGVRAAPGAAGQALEGASAAPPAKRVKGEPGSPRAQRAAQQPQSPKTHGAGKHPELTAAAGSADAQTEAAPAAPAGA